MKNIFFDFDGTLVSNKRRLFTYFINNIDPQYKNVIPINEYWNLKRLGIHEVYWLNLKYNTNIDITEWDKKKAAEIENIEYLEKEYLFPYTKSVLSHLQEEYNLYLVTRRSNQKNVINEIESFKLASFFREIIVLAHGDLSKADVIKKSIKGISIDDIFVGDTEDDIFSGLTLGVKTYFVLSGIRGKWMLNKYFSNAKDKIGVIQSINKLKELY
jgi:phosphoglycolate phosphatase-like HAD superfamily hydrolase